MGSLYKTNLHLHQPNTRAPVVLPMLCSRSSFKDVRWDQSAGSRPSNDDDDPLSPKVGCMGQVKRKNRVVGFPTPNGNGRIPVAARPGCGKYPYLKRMMFSAAAVTKPVTPAISRCRVHGRSTVVRTSCEKEKVGTFNIVSMDPPLPVTRKAKKDGNAADGDGDRGNLWKRRLGGMDLKKLELQKTPNPSWPSSCAAASPCLIVRNS